MPSFIKLLVIFIEVGDMIGFLSSIGVEEFGKLMTQFSWVSMIVLETKKSTWQKWNWICTSIVNSLQKEPVA